METPRETKPEEKQPTEIQAPENDTVIKSLWIKESTWERLGITKNAFNLTWSEFIDLLLSHLQQSGYLPPETLSRLQSLSKDPQDTPFQKKVLHLGASPWETAGLLKSLERETELLNLHLEHLIQTVEDHAECLLTSLDNQPPKP